MIGAFVIVMTEVFVLSDNAPSIKWWEGSTQTASNEYGINVDNLRRRHEDFLQNGIPLPDIVTADNAIPEPLELTNDYVFVQQRQDIKDPISDLADIEPAVGIEIDADLQVEQKKSEKIEDVILNLQNLNYEEAYASDDYVEKVSYDQAADPSEPETIIYKSPKATGRIAVIIDDMGLSLRSRLVEVMDGPLTLSYLPYAKDLDKSTARALKNGHELMVHMPMEPMSKSTDPGPHALKTDQSKQQLLENLNWNLSQFDGFVGVNNHMGSRMTKNKAAMDVVMEELKKRNLFFIDSRTISSSVAAQSAKEHGLSYNQRDIFLDHEISKEFIEGALKKLENKAHEQGYAIAIGHPHKETIDALKAWIPTLKGKGLTLVKASDVLLHPDTQNGRILEVRATTP